MEEIELKINMFNSNWSDPKKITYLYDSLESISKLKSYCDIEIYLHHLADTISKSHEEIFKEFYSRYTDKNKNEANYIVTKYKMEINNG